MVHRDELDLRLVEHASKAGALVRQGEAVEAILAGGSTLRDFVNASGNPGYFQQQHWVYGRAGEPCRVCSSPVVQIKQGQRSSFYCSLCQK